MGKQDERGIGIKRLPKISPRFGVKGLRLRKERGGKKTRHALLWEKLIALLMREQVDDEFYCGERRESRGPGAKLE